jgi:hypothetical protein
MVIGTCNAYIAEPKITYVFYPSPDVIMPFLADLGCPPRCRVPEAMIRSDYPACWTEEIWKKKSGGGIHNIFEYQ